MAPKRPTAEDDYANVDVDDYDYAALGAVASDLSARRVPRHPAAVAVAIRIVAPSWRVTS